jgi:Flp pilus assembly protein TadG
MNPRPAPARRPRPHDTGQITAYLAVLLAALLLMLGLVSDGGRALAARLRATDHAEEAARAAAQALDLAAYRRDGTLRLDPAQARARARAYLATTGDTLTAVTITGDQATVTVTRTEPTRLLGPIGLRTIHVTGTGTARAQPAPARTGPP